MRQVTPQKISAYIDSLLAQGLAPKTINCRLDSVRGFYAYMGREEEIPLPNPVKKGYALRLARPLPRYLKDEEVMRLFQVIRGLRDRAIFMLMLRCGLRVEEIAHLSLQDLDLAQRRILVCCGKGSKGRVVYISHDAHQALRDYLKSRSSSKAKEVFLVGKGIYRGTSISVRGIQKRIEYYARKTSLKHILSSSSPYHGHPVAQCGCGPCHHPGSVGAHEDQDDSTVCKNLESSKCRGIITKRWRSFSKSVLRKGTKLYRFSDVRVGKDLTEGKNRCKMITHNLPISQEKSEFVTYSLPVQSLGREEGKRSYLIFMN